MSWKPEYIILIMVSTLIDYLSAIQIARTKKIQKKKIFLALSLCTNLGLLFFFKYFNFFSESTRTILQKVSIPLDPITLKVLLPVGISFYTFQTISYTIDVYRGKIAPEKHLGVFAVYVSFFPQLVAGPIERAKHLLPQFYEKHTFEYERVTNGLKLMLWGFFKKIVIADRLSMLVNTIYNDPANFGGASLLMATVLFAFQIYCDFSGYTDIAIGSAQVLGFRLMDNFKRPYFSRNISEFWRKWHISLSTIFHDYVFVPLYVSLQKKKYIKQLKGKTKHKIAFCLATLIGLSLLGLWHGASWTFVIFGAYHGVFICLYYLTRKWWDKIPKLVNIAINFIIVTFGWVWFRANNVGDALYIYQQIFTNLQLESVFIGTNTLQLTIGVITILFMEGVHLLQEHRSIRSFMSERSKLLRWTIYSIIIFMILFLGVFNEQQFIYFQF